MLVVTVPPPLHTFHAHMFLLRIPNQILDTNDTSQKESLKAEWEEVFDRMIRIQSKMDALRGPAAIIKSGQVQSAAEPPIPSSGTALPFESVSSDEIQDYITKLKELTKDDNTDKVLYNEAEVRLTLEIR